jgi:hypothetical protein
VVEVVAGAGVPAQPGQGDAVERGVGLTVAAAVDSLGRCGCQGRGSGGVDGGVWWGDRVSGEGCLVSGCVPWLCVPRALLRGPSRQFVGPSSAPNIGRDGELLGDEFAGLLGADTGLSSNGAAVGAENDLWGLAPGAGGQR